MLFCVCFDYITNCLTMFLLFKGLTVSCDYKFSASLELKELPPYIHINVNKLSQVALIDSPGDGVWVG